MQAASAWRLPGCCDFSNVACVFRAGHWEGSWSFFFRGENYLQMFSSQNPTKNAYVKTGSNFNFLMVFESTLGVQPTGFTTITIYDSEKSSDVYCCKPWLGHVESCCAANLHDMNVFCWRNGLAMIPWTWNLSFGINGPRRCWIIFLVLCMVENAGGQIYSYPAEA